MHQIFNKTLIVEVEKISREFVFLRRDSLKKKNIHTLCDLLEQQQKCTSES